MPSRKPSRKQDAAPAEDQVDAATAAAIDAVEGLDETTKRALKIPQVRAAIEQQLGEVDTARQQLATERALAQQFAQASFLESFPELAALPPQHLEAGLQQLAQQNPQRFPAGDGDTQPGSVPPGVGAAGTAGAGLRAASADRDMGRRSKMLA